MATRDSACRGLEFFRPIPPPAGELSAKLWLGLQTFKRGARGDRGETRGVTGEWGQRNKTQIPRALIPLSPFPCHSPSDAAT